VLGAAVGLVALDAQLARLIYELFSLGTSTPCAASNDRDGAPEVCVHVPTAAAGAVLATAIARRAARLRLRGRWGVLVLPVLAEPGLSCAIRPLDASRGAPSLCAEAGRLGTDLARHVRRIAAAALAASSSKRLTIGRGWRAPAALTGGVPAEPLTPREAEVLELFLRGLAIDSIACELEVSPFTARNHLKSIFHKLGCGSQRELRELFAATVIYWRG
jgi:DNA-binding CsgD family transcriptional regulator